MRRHASPFAFAAVGAAIAALTLALVGKAGTERTLKSTIHVYQGSFTTRIGDVNSQVVSCAGEEKAIGGGYLVDSGNFVYVVAATVNKARTGYGVVAFVPNAIAEEGVEPATIRVKVTCAEAGKPIVP
jgi:hypothetical protein